MSGWSIFFIIALVMGVIVSNLMLLRQGAKIKIPDHIIKAVAERRKKEEQANALKDKEAETKKPTDE